MRDRLLCLLMWFAASGFSGAITASAQSKLPVLKAGSPVLSMRVDTTYYPKRWSIAPSVKPDVFDVSVRDKPVRVAFIAETDSVVRTVRAGESVDFVVLTASGDSAYTRIRGMRFVEPAVFNSAYSRAHRGKTFVEIPDIYELVNVVFALTKTAQSDDNLIEKSTAYYRSMMQYFAPHKNEPIVNVLDSLLATDGSLYFPLKMDAYAFFLDRNGVIQKSPVYDRIAWGSENSLRPYLLQLQRFAEKTKFTDFYRKHKPYYASLVRAYSDSVGVADMQSWLNRNFPTTRYDSFKIIFSPLVSSNQSANWFENGGFREAQAHVNFPFPDPSSDAGFSKKANNVRNGNIVFTELNHAFINPEAGKKNYDGPISAAFNNLDTWLADGKPAKQGYNNPFACFNEHLNWGLVSLRYVDYAPRAELDTLLRRVEKMMVERRGFKRFAEFNQFLVSLYQKRSPGTTVADLYPQLIHWFEVNKQHN